MGMSASQVRFLSLQSRKNDVGRQLMSLSNRKMSLSRDMNKVSQHYTEALNQKSLKWSNDSGATYNNLSYDLMMKPNDLNYEKPYIISTNDGKVVLDSVQNLVGARNGSYVTLTDATFSAAAPAELQGKSINFTNLAKWITSATTISGETGKVYNTADGMLAGTSNANAYVVPNGPETYGFENTLRYQVFQELGLVSGDTTTEYKKLLNEMYGTEDAYKNGNYSDLLNSYLSVHMNGSAENIKMGHSDLNHVNAMSGISVTKNGTNYGNYSTYFGHIDATTGTWAVGTDGKTVGSLMGNLAVAQLAITEYDNWCNELKEFNLTGDTSFTFNSTSGRTNTQTIQAFLNMNNNVDSVVGNADDDGGIANDFESILGTNDDGSVVTLFDKSMLTKLHSNNTNILDTNWNDIYVNGNASVELNGDYTTKAGLVTGFIQGLQKSLSQGTKYQGVDGNSWSFSSTSKNNSDFVTVEGKQISVTDAANMFAMKQTIKYYGELEEYNNNYGGCGSCHSDGHFYNKAADVGNKAEDNVLGRSNSGRCFWHSLTHFVGGFFHTIAGGLWTAISSIITAGGLWGGFGNDTGLLSKGWGNFSDSWKGDGAKYTLNMANVEKTYFTYYQMYMMAFKDGKNLLDNQDLSAVSTETKQALQNTAPLNDALKAFAEGGTKCTTSPKTAVDGSIYMVYTSGPAIGERVNETVSDVTLEDGTVQRLTSYDNYVATLSDGSSIQIVTNGNENSFTQTQTIKFTSPKTAESVDKDGNKTTVTYDSIEVDNAGKTTYYYNNREVQITYQSVSSNISYGGLSIAPRHSKYADKVYAYITPDKKFQEKLEKDVEDAQSAIDDMNEKMKNFFGSKENKLMDYYDAIFLRVAQNGWINDDKVNSPNVGQKYLNNKLMNNDYFVTVCQEKVDQSGYNYTSKLATSVTKIFEVNDDNAQNQALSKYESDKALISNKEAKIDAQMQKLETEQEAINTEMESVQKIVSDNIDKTFKMFA